MKINLLPFLLTILFLPFVVVSSLAQAAAPEGQTTLFEYFSSIEEDVVDITLESNFNQFIQGKFKEEYQPATLSFKDHSGIPIEVEAKIRARGNSRKKICQLPPIKLKVPKKTLLEMGLDSAYNKYKLVIRCKNSNTYNDYILKEYLAYKLMELMYPYSFKVRLLRITSRNVKKNGKIKEEEQYGFLIENEEEMADRLNAHFIERTKSGFHQVDRDACLQMALCQYMIGNTDWALPNLHNVKLVKIPAIRKPVPIPYDFDYSGLVNTDYAVVHHTLSLKSVTERMYLGPKMEDPEVRKLLGICKEKQETAMQLINKFELLGERERNEMTRFIQDFFDAIGQEKYMVRVLTR